MAYQGRREEAEAVAHDEAGDDYGYSDDDVDVPEEEEEEDTEEFAPQRGGAVGPPKSQRGLAARGAPKKGKEGRVWPPPVNGSQPGPAHSRARCGSIMLLYTARGWG